MRATPELKSPPPLSRLPSRGHAAPPRWDRRAALLAAAALVGATAPGGGLPGGGLPGGGLPGLRLGLPDQGPGLGRGIAPWGAARAAEASEVTRTEAELQLQPDDDGAFALVSQPAGTSGSGSGAEPSQPTTPAPASVGLRRFGSIGEAAAACPDGGVVLVAAGRYRERLVLNRPVAVRAWPQGAAVEVVWETREPYQSTVEIGHGASSGGLEVELRGLAIRHASKSVANNYGVYIKSGSPVLADCDISSATGAGVGVEGASPKLLGCRVHDCARQGLAIFGSASGEALLDLDLGLAPSDLLDPFLTGGVVQGCDVYGNALDGVLVRSGASPDLLDNKIYKNGGVGVNLQDCAGRYERNAVYDNARGAVAVSPMFDLDPDSLTVANSLRGLIRRL